MTCEWCLNPDAEDVDGSDGLCDAHEAEYLGISLHELDRMRFEQAAELADL